MYHPQGPTVFELARQCLTSVERGYDLLARKFDYTPFRTPDAILERVAAHVAQQGTVDAALDVCCGTGAGLRWIRPLCRTRAVGLDLSRGMLEEAARRLADAPGSARLAFVRGDALDPPAELAGAFDLVTCFGAFGHIEARDEPRLVRAVKTVLRPGGRFVFVTAEHPPVLSAAHAYARAFNAAMRVRNAVWRPPFVMYYLTFLLPRARALLEAEGFTVQTTPGGFPPPHARYVIVTATRGAGA